MTVRDLLEALNLLRPDQLDWPVKWLESTDYGDEYCEVGSVRDAQEGEDEGEEGAGERYIRLVEKPYLSDEEYRKYLHEQD